MKKLISAAVIFIVFFNITESAYAVAIVKNPVTNGLVGYLPFEPDTIFWNTKKITNRTISGDKLVDIKNMSATSSPKTSPVRGEALLFDGVDDYIDIGKVITGTTKNFSIGGWYSSPTGAANVLIGNTEANLGANGMSLRVMNIGGGTQIVHIILRGAGCGDIVLFPNSPADGRPSGWDHLFITSNASKLKGYLNGKEFFSVKSCAVVNSFPFWVGKEMNNPASFKGMIDEVRVYNRGLSPSEVLALYNMYKN